MPLDIDARGASAGASGSGSTGTRDPGLAHGTRSPATKFRTPAHTTCSPVPSSTLATQSLSEFGMVRDLQHARDHDAAAARPRDAAISSTFTPCAA